MVSEHDDAPEDSPSEDDAARDETSTDGTESSTDASPGTDDETEDESGVALEATDVTDDEQTWAVVLHASAFSGLVGPFGNILGPLLVWLIKKDESEFLDASGKEALNFQLTWTMLLLGALLSILVGIGVLLVPVVVVAWIVLVVLATVRASEREVYDYPLTLDLIE